MGFVCVASCAHTICVYQHLGMCMSNVNCCHCITRMRGGDGKMTLYHRDQRLLEEPDSTGPVQLKICPSPVINAHANKHTGAETHLCTSRERYSQPFFFSSLNEDLTLSFNSPSYKKHEMQLNVNERRLKRVRSRNQRLPLKLLKILSHFSAD